MPKRKGKEKGKESEVIKAYLNGDELDVIVKKYGISKSTIGRIRKRNRIGCRPLNRAYREPKHKDIEGKRFGFLVVNTVTTKKKYSGRGYLASCTCLNCGKRNVYAYPYDLMSGKQVSCGCVGGRQQAAGKYSCNFTGHEEISGQYWSSVRIRARKKKLNFDIDIEYIWDLFISQNRKCLLTGLLIEFPKTCKDTYTASLDRIDSGRGYVKGNVQWVHRDINLMKRDYPLDKFIQLCKMVANHENSSNKRTV